MHVRCFVEKVREVRLKWFGHVQWRDGGYICGRMARFELSGRRPRGRSKMKLMDVVKENMKSVCIKEEETEDRVRWRQMIHCREQPKRKDDDTTEQGCKSKVSS